MKRLFVILLVTLAGCVPQIPHVFEKTPIVCVHHDCFEVEIADSYEERKTGLMFRESLDKHKGMLFVYPDKDQRLFWMKNTRIPLDILWITDGEVVFVSDNTPPCKNESCPVYGTNIPVDYVLEVSAEHNFSKGMKVTINGI